MLHGHSMLHGRGHGHEHGGSIGNAAAPLGAAINGDENAAMVQVGVDWPKVWPQDGRRPGSGITAPTPAPLTENEADSAFT
jgi:hypothetical protein